MPTAFTTLNVTSRGHFGQGIGDLTDPLKSRSREPDIASGFSDIAAWYRFPDFQKPTNQFPKTDHR